MINVKLSDKALTYIIEALRFQIDAMEKQLENNTLPDDDRADLGNDLQFIKAVLHDLSRSEV